MLETEELVDDDKVVDNVVADDNEDSDEVETVLTLL